MANITSRKFVDQDSGEEWVENCVPDHKFKPDDLIAIGAGFYKVVTSTWKAGTKIITVRKCVDNSKQIDYIRNSLQPVE